MAPWWSRPTAEGPEEGPDTAREAPPPSPAPTPPATTPEPPEEVAQPAAAAEAAAPPLLPALEDLLPPVGPATDEPPAAAEGAAATDDEEEHAEAGDENGGEGVAERRPRRRRSGRGRGEKAEARVAAGEPRPVAEPVREARPAAREEPRTAPPRDRREPRELREAKEARDLRERENETMTFGVPQLQDLIREIIVSVPDRSTAAYEERKLALFCDLENVALGARDSGTNFDINLVLERLLEKGKIIVKKAYADWNRYADYKRPFHEAGIELIDIPQRSYSGKNSADIKMVVDAMDISYAKEHLDTFVLLSGDSDFSPLVSKLKENDKYVIGVGVKNSSSALLIDSCDEFIYYEDIWRDVERVPKLDALAKKEQELFGLLIEAILALTRENKDVLWGSMIKQTMQRKRPSFNEGYYGYSTFSELLEDAERKSIVKLKRDQRSGSYIVTGFARAESPPSATRRR